MLCDMRRGGTDQLIAEFLALALAIQQHLTEKPGHLSRLQMDSLSDAISGLHRYMTVWKKQEMARRGSLGRNNGKRKTSTSRRRIEEP